MSTEVIENTLVIPVDREHSAMRLAIVLTFIAVWAVGFVLFSAIIPNEGFSLLAVILGFAAAYGVTALLERYLKTRWPSGRVVQVDKSGVKVILKGKQQQEMLSEDPVNTHFWTFKISKRARVPKGWSMLACALEYENEYLTVYTFMSPNQFSSLETADQFKKLIAKRKGKSQEDAREDLRIAGEQRRLRDAENQRWMFGAEMTPNDFITYLTRLKTQFSEWTPAN